MDSIKQLTENNFKKNYISKNMELNAQKFLDNCLKILENFTLMLVNTNDKINRFPKLNYCYYYFNTIRLQLDNSASLHHNSVMEIAKSLIKRLQNSLGLFDSSRNNFSTSTEPNKHVSILSPSINKYNICRRLNKRKSKFHRKSHDSINRCCHQKTFLNKFYGSLFCLNSKTASNRKSFNIQHIIDQMYCQIQAGISETGVDQAELFKELNTTMKRDILTKSFNSKMQSPNNNHIKSVKYKEQLWSGDCKLSDDSRDSFSDQFDNLLALNNLDIDLSSLSEKIFSSNNGFILPNKRFRKYSELDEGFSENDFLFDTDNKQEENESPEFMNYEKFSYCGDCHYNSSNSKSDEKRASVLNETMIQFNDDGSDSDGGTELLNSVNDTVNKFNAFMQHNLSADHAIQVEEKSSNFSLNSVDQIAAENLWSPRYANITDNRGSYDENANITLQNKSFEKNELLGLDLNSSMSLLSDSFIYKEDRSEPKMVSVNSVQQQSSLSSLSNFNYDSLSKMVVSPVSIQNWCYNFSQITSPCNFGFQNKQTLNMDIVNTTPESYCAGKVSNWLPPISHGLITSNSYFIGSSTPQQPFHRIMIAPHISLPPGNIVPTMQHNIIHLPQIFHQVPHSLIDSDYFERRQIPSQTQFSNPNNNNSSSDFNLIPSLNLLANSNCSNTALSTNMHQPISIIKSSLDKSQRACCFYMRGGCKKEDCEYAHDLSKVTCKFWEKGDCFKADTCPFKHGYMKE